MAAFVLENVLWKISFKSFVSFGQNILNNFFLSFFFSLINFPDRKMLPIEKKKFSVRHKNPHAVRGGSPRTHSREKKSLEEHRHAKDA